MTQWEYRIVENSDAAYSQIAEMLNEMKLYTAEGKQFHKSQVKRIVDRSLVEA